MCLAIPGRIIAKSGTTARVDFAGVTRDADLVLVPHADVGDYVLVHAGFAIQTLSEEEARATLRLFRELADAVEKDEERRR